MSSTESLQVAQILADLNDLQNTDPKAALNLLYANKTLSARLARRRSRPTNTTNSSLGTGARTGTPGLPDPPKFDNLGRRIVKTPEITPTITRMSSELSMTSTTSSSAGTALGPSAEGDEDLTRAKTLMDLYEKRDSFKQMGDTGLMRARERVDQVIAKRAERESAAHARHLRSSAL